MRYQNGLSKCTLHDFGFEVNELFRGDLKFHILVEIGLAREGIDLGFGQQGVRPWPGWTSKPIFQGRLLALKTIFFFFRDFFFSQNPSLHNKIDFNVPFYRLDIPF